MPAIGITGGISTGKSTFCRCLEDIVPSAKFFDADEVARQLVDLEEVKQELLQQFGLGIFLRSGDLNREAVRTIIFQDAAKKQALENILHPRIRRQWSVEADRHRKSSEFFFADIPLLYETGGETLCDRVVVVACSPDIQLDNLKCRSKKKSNGPITLFGTTATGSSSPIRRKTWSSFGVGKNGRRIKERRGCGG